LIFLLYLSGGWPADRHFSAVVSVTTTAEAKDRNAGRP
jgi:hypothetical protein